MSLRNVSFGNVTFGNVSFGNVSSAKKPIGKKSRCPRHVIDCSASRQGAAKESAGYRNLLLSGKKEECMTLKFLSSGLSLTPASPLTEKAFSSGLEATTDVRVTKKLSYYFFSFGDVTNFSCFIFS